MEIRGRIHGVGGPTVVAGSMAGAKMNTVCLVGRDGLLGEIIRIRGEMATIQVYEDTSGLTVGAEVVSTGRPLTVMLGPGLLSGIFDGTQRPLKKLEKNGSPFIARGLKSEPLDTSREWEFEPLKKPGDTLHPGEAIGAVLETESIIHRVLCPPDVSGTVREICSGTVSGVSPVCVLDGGVEIGLYQEWPVRRPRPFKRKLPPSAPFVTGQRVFDTLLPVAVGGTAIVPGGFGTGKTVVEQTIAKYSRAEVVVYIGCGERGNEMTEILTDFPALTDPVTGLPLSQRTVIIINTSNMPVAAREASIFTGVTIAEYFRDMGYSVALLADSISRWAEALREISSRLEEMPGEEGFPPYLATQLGSFYERAGRVETLAPEATTGSLTIISAVSPPGGDFSEPVTQASLRFAGALWALDAELAYRRHFPAVKWQSSFSLYYNELAGWFSSNVAPDMDQMRSRLLRLLQAETELKEIVQIIGAEALQEKDRLSLEAAELAREAFLKQSVFSDADAFNSYEKQYWMLKVIFAFVDGATAALERGAFVETLIETPLRPEILGMKEWGNDGFREKAASLIAGMDKAFGAAEGA